MLFNIVEFGIPLISLFSIFLFLPISLIVFYSFKAKYNDILLIIISALFVLIISPIQLVTLSTLILANYVIMREMIESSITQKKYATLLMVISALINISVWIFFSFSGNLKGYPYLIGGAVVPFLLVDTNLKIYRGQLDFIPNIKEYICHSFFFVRLFVGPFNSISQKKTTMQDLNVSSNLKNGFMLFSRGMFQYLFFGTRLLKLANVLSGFSIKSTTPPSIWLFAITFSLGMYHVLAGVCGAAEGAAVFFGKKLSSGFTPPLSNNSLAGFARGFHGSFEKLIRNFFKLNNDNPVVNIIMRILIVLTTGIAIGLWLDFSLMFFVLGLFVAISVVCEFFIFKVLFKNKSKWFNRLFMLIVVVMFLSLLTLGYSNWDINILKQMYGLSAPATNYNAYHQIVYYFTSYFFVILCALFLCTSIPKGIHTYLKLNFNKPYSAVLWIVHLLLFLLSITLLI